MICALFCAPLTSTAYSLTNCWSYATERLGQTVSARELIANATTTPTVGSIAVMRYHKQGLDHFAYVEFVTEDFIVISETNYKAGQFGYRFLPLDYPHLLGYYPVQPKE